MKTYIVTGGAGFIGSNLTIELLKRGNKVLVIDCLERGRLSNLPKDENLIFRHVDISNYEYLFKNVKDVFKNGEKVDGIFHLAASFGNEKSLLSPRTDAEVNIIGSINIMELARELNCKVVYADSSSTYGAITPPYIEEVSGVDPSTPYAVSKLVGGYYVKLYGNLFKMPFVVFKYHNVYGPHDHPDILGNVIPNFIAKMMKNEQILITGETATRDFTYVKDLVEANILGMETDKADGLVVNIGRGYDTPVIEVAEEIKKQLNSSSEIKIGEKRQWDKVNRRYPDVTRLNTILGYKCTTEIPEGISKIIQWFKDEKISN